MGCADAGAGVGEGEGCSQVPRPLPHIPIACWDAPEVRTPPGSMEVALGGAQWVIPICRRLLQVWEGGIAALHTLVSAEQV